MPKRYEPILKRLGEKGIIFDPEQDKFVHHTSKDVINQYIDSCMWRYPIPAKGNRGREAL